MNFSNYLTADNIILKQDVSSKKKVLEYLAESLSTQCTINKSAIFDRLIARESLGSTAVGKQIAIPHCRLTNLEKPIICILLTTEGIDFDAPDGLPVRIFVVLVVPEDATQHHLDLLSSIVSYFNDNVVIEQLLEAKDKHVIFNLIKESM